MPVFSLIALAAAVAAVPTKMPTLAELRWERRVLLVSAPLATDPEAAAQRRVIGEIARSGDDRHLVLVEVLGNTVRRARDSADSLHHTFKLPTDRFTVILIGKDGGEKQRSTAPIPVATLTGIIDVMPMRRNGER